MPRSSRAGAPLDGAAFEESLRGPVFALQSVPGWEHTRLEEHGFRHGDPVPGLHEWRGECYRSQVTLYDDDGGVRVDFGGTTAAEVRGLMTVLAMIAAELERRERAAWCGNPDCDCKEASER